jgi:hypothetical protein
MWGFVGCGCSGFVFLSVRRERGACICVFFSSASACAEKLHDVLKTPLYILNPPKQLNAFTDVKRVLHDVLKTPYRGVENTPAGTSLQVFLYRNRLTGLIIPVSLFL